MKMMRHVVVLDADDVAAVSGFWAAMFDGVVVDDDERFHCVVDADRRWVVGVQRSPGHVRPEWPDGVRQQVHIDLHVTDPGAAHDQAMAHGAQLLAGETSLSEPQGFRVYADPAGHPFCIGWGHPDDDAIRRFVDERAGPAVGESR